MSIRKRGKAWEIVIEMGKDAEGNRVQKTFTFYGTKPEAKDKEAELRTLYRKGGTALRNMTLSEYMIYWLDTFKKPTLAGRTYDSYKETIEVHIAKDDIGAKKWDRLITDDFQQYYNRKKAAGLSGTSVLYHHRILHAAYNQAFKGRHIPWNPVSGAIPPDKNKVKPSKTEPARMAAIIMQMKNQAVLIATIISALTGLREGEICALTWPDLDFEKRVAFIHGAIKREQGVLKHGPTKNKEDRWVPLSPALTEVLKKYKELQKQTLADLGIKDDGTNYVMLPKKDSRYFDPHYISEYFTKEITDMKGIGKITFHGCRHFLASSMYEKGADVKLVADCLGHGKLGNVTADIYIHTRVEQMRPFIDWLDEPVLSDFVKDIDAHIYAHKPKKKR